MPAARQRGAKQIVRGLVRKLRVLCLHFQLAFRDAEHKTIAFSDRRVERKSLRSLAEAYVPGRMEIARTKALGFINPEWGPARG